MDLKKNPKANLEPRKASFFSLGLVVSLALVFMAFDYRIYDQNHAVIPELGDLPEDIVEIIPPTRLVPPPPPLPPPPPINVLVIQPNETKLPEPDFFFPEPGETPPLAAPPEVIEEEPIRITAEIMPEFPGGEAALFGYLGKKLNYPSIAFDNGISGTVYVSFVIGKNGEITDIDVLKGVSGGCTEEALRVIKGMPKWKPGEQNGKAVKVRYTLPIKFKLKS